MNLFKILQQYGDQFSLIKEAVTRLLTESVVWHARFQSSDQHVCDDRARAVKLRLWLGEETKNKSKSSKE